MDSNLSYNTEPQANQRTQKHRLHVVSISKLITMTCLTWGLYIPYWSYCHWRLIRGQSGFALIPLLCGVFGSFLIYPLMKRAITYSKELDLTVEGTALGVTLRYWVPYLLFVSWQFWAPDQPEESQSLYNMFMLPLALLVMSVTLTLVALVQIQQAANAYEGDPTGLRNAQITWANGLWIIISWSPSAALLALISHYANH